MAVQLNYLAPPGWLPENPDENYVVIQFKMQLADGIDSAKFKDGAASVAAESSTGTWTKVEDRPDSGLAKADEFKAIVFNMDEKNHMFKVAYKTDLFEHDNMAGFLAGPVGNIGGMKMVKGLRIMDIRFPKAIVTSFPGPRFGIEGVRELLNQDEKHRKMPLLGTVPKPKVGRTAQEQALLARRLWTAADGSYDFIKDDENLTSLPFNTFEDRAKLVLEVQSEVEKQSSYRKLYLCNITHSNFDIMVKRADMIKSFGGRCMMLDVVASGVSAVHSMRIKNPELIIHAHRAMHAFITRESGPGVSGEGDINGFSVSMFIFAKMYRMLGVDTLHSGSPKSKMEDYGEAEEIGHILRDSVTQSNAAMHTLGQNWFGMKNVWPVASGGLHPGVMDVVINKMTSDSFVQLGGGVLGHPKGAERGVEAAIEARNAVYGGMTIAEYVSKNPESALSEAVGLWGKEPKIVY